jgi:hypothetical protein
MFFLSLSNIRKLETELSSTLYSLTNYGLTNMRFVSHIDFCVRQPDNTQHRVNPRAQTSRSKVDEITPNVVITIVFMGSSGVASFYSDVE